MLRELQVTRADSTAACQPSLVCGQEISLYGIIARL